MGLISCDCGMPRIGYPHTATCCSRHHCKTHGSRHHCKTHGAVYETNVTPTIISCTVFLPPGITASECDDALIQRIHDGMEAALAPLFPQYGPDKPKSWWPPKSTSPWREEE